MDQTERQVIDELFGKVKQAEMHSGPRDPEAETYIQAQVAQQPAAPYYMSQAIVIQEQALNAANARIQELEADLASRPAAGGGGFLSSLFGGGAGTPPARRRGSTALSTMDPRIAAYAPASGAHGHGAHGAPGYGAHGAHGHRRGGFLGGAMEMALGVAGGMLLGSAIASMFAPEEAMAEEPAGEDAPAEDDGGDEEF